jgi:hypothetical protein
MLQSMSTEFRFKSVSEFLQMGETLYALVRQHFSHEVRSCTYNYKQIIQII